MNEGVPQLRQPKFESKLSGDGTTCTVRVHGVEYVFKRDAVGETKLRLVSPEGPPAPDIEHKLKYGQAEAYARAAFTGRDRQVARGVPGANHTPSVSGNTTQRFSGTMGSVDIGSASVQREAEIHALRNPDPK